MILKQIAYSVCKCLECEHLMIYKPASHGFPGICGRCGVPHNVEITQEQRMHMEKMQKQRGPHTQTIII